MVMYSFWKVYTMDKLIALILAQKYNLYRRDELEELSREQLLKVVDSLFICIAVQEKNAPQN